MHVVFIYLFTALSRHYNAKMSFEHQLPTASQKLKVTDECILAAVVSLVTCTSKVRFLIVISQQRLILIMCDLLFRQQVPFGPKLSTIFRLKRLIGQENNKCDVVDCSLVD